MEVAHDDKRMIQGFENVESEQARVWRSGHSRKRMVRFRSFSGANICTIPLCP